MDSDRQANATPAVAGRHSMDRGSMAMLSLGHCCADLCQTAVAALIPFLVADRGYSVGSASLLVLAVTISSSFMQPVFGHLSDRRSLIWTMPTGLILAAAGLALAGFSHDHATAFIAVLVGGIGIAAFHPEASRYARYASGPGRTAGMSIFAVGGNLGLALGPAFVVPAVLFAGIGAGMAIVACVPAIVGLAFLPALPRMNALRPIEHGAGRRDESHGRDQWQPFGCLSLVIAVRSTVDYGLITFVPLYYVRHLGLSKATGDTAITIMLLAGAVGTLLGGRLADRIGRRPVLLGAMGLLAPLLIAFHLSGATQATVLLALAGAMTVATYSVTVVMGQEMLPNHLGIASGVTLGLAIGFGGAAAALLGLLADSVGVGNVLWGIVFLPLGGLLLSLLLPISDAADAAHGASLAEAAAPASGEAA